VTHLVVSYGYAAVALLVLVEAFGVPLPGETILIAAGVYAGQTHRLSAPGLWAVAAATAAAGGVAGYVLGRAGGYRLVRRVGPRLHIGERELKVGRYLFDRHGAGVVFFGRFVSILRTYAALLAGINRMRWRPFLVADVAGAVLWAGVYVIASYEAGGAFRRFNGTLDVILAVVAVGVIAAVVLTLRRKVDALAGRAEAAYPGDLE
jgi:membrane protein DedA with SNARE-associated domain